MLVWTELTLLTERDVAVDGDEVVSVWFWYEVVSILNEGCSCSGFCSLSSLSYKR